MSRRRAPDSGEPISDARRHRWSLALLLPLPLIGLGHGSDWDTYLVLQSGRALWEEGAWWPSRRPGYLLHEAAVGWLSSWGGALACNAVTWCFAALAVLATRSLLLEARLGRAAGPLVLALVTCPWFWLNAASTIDYCWSLGLLVFSIALAWHGRCRAAGLCGGLAVAVRFSAALPLAAALLVLAMRRRSVSTVLALALAAAVSIPFYLPSLAWAEGSVSRMLSAHAPDDPWPWSMHVGRFAYKNVLVWGWPGAAWLLVLSLGARRRSASLDRDQRDLALVSLGVVLATELLFASFPFEIAYLLPAVPFVVILFGLLTGGAVRPACWLAGLLALHALACVDVARPDVPDAATSVRWGLHVRPGPLAEDLRRRWELRACRTPECWLRWREGREGSQGLGGRR